MKVVNIDLDLIEQNDNVRGIYIESDQSELMTSMKKDGLLQPVGLRKLPNGKFDAIWGNRRILAAKKLGWGEIPANIVDIATDLDRDILQLIENFKRKNTTVAEDGHAFSHLRDSGMTLSEIAARLGITKIRVETAIDVYERFPKEFKSVILNTTPNSKTQRAGRISASIASQINALRKKHDLNRDQMKTILNYARQDGTTAGQLSSMAPLIQSGMEIQEALETVSKITHITLGVMMQNDQVVKLEKKYGKNIHEIMYERMEEDTELKVVRYKRHVPYASKRSEFLPSRQPRQ